MGKHCRVELGRKEREGEGEIEKGKEKRFWLLSLVTVKFKRSVFV